jgi:hypothetical protein
MQKLIIKIKNTDSTLELNPTYGSKILLKNLKWVKFNSELYVSEIASIINVSFPFTNFNHIFKGNIFIRKDREKLYYISTSWKEEQYYSDINPIFTLKEAKTICQNIAEDKYDLEYGSTFFIN